MLNSKEEKSTTLTEEIQLREKDKTGGGGNISNRRISASGCPQKKLGPLGRKRLRHATSANNVPR